MALYATVDDVEREYDGVIPPEKIPWVASKLDSAEVVLLSAVADIPARIIAGTTKAAAVRLVLCTMVIRVLNNPKGIRTQSAGPFSYTLERESATGQLFVSAADKRILGVSRAQTIRLLDEALPNVTMHRLPEYPL